MSHARGFASFGLLAFLLAMPALARGDDLTNRLRELENGAETTRGTVTRVGPEATLGTSVTCYFWVVGCPGYAQYRAEQRSESAARVAREQQVRDAAHREAVAERRHQELRQDLQEIGGTYARCPFGGGRDADGFCGPGK
jgi:hypothetical protein